LWLSDASRNVVRRPAAAKRSGETEDKFAGDANRKQRRKANAELENDLLAGALFGFAARLFVTIDHSYLSIRGIGGEYGYGHI